MSPVESPTLAPREVEEIARANDSGLQPVVFVHGLWLLASSWESWRARFEESGYATIAPGWPGDPESVSQARENPDLLAGTTVQEATDHYLAAIGRLVRRPAVVGHSFGGLIAQKLAGVGASVATVAIDNAPFRGVLPLPVSSLRSAAPVLRNPANAGRAVSLTFEQFSYGWANNLSEAEARRLFEAYHVAAPGKPLFQAAAANLNPSSETKVDIGNPDRGPLLVVAGTNDTTVPLAITRATYKIQRRNPGITEIVEVVGRGHSLVIDEGWREIADLALGFIRRFA